MYGFLWHPEDLKALLSYFLIFWESINIMDLPKNPMAESVIGMHLCKDLVYLVHSYAETSIEALQRKDLGVAKYLFQREQNNFNSLAMARKFLKNLLKLDVDVPQSFFKWLIQMIVQISVKYKLSYCTMPFDVVAKFGRVDLFELLLEMAQPKSCVALCPSVNTLHKAIYNKHFPLVKFIVKSNLTTSDGKVARLCAKSLDMAVWSDSVPMFRWIMSQLACYKYHLCRGYPGLIKSQTMFDYVYKITHHHDGHLARFIDRREVIAKGNLDLVLKVCKIYCANSGDDSDDDLRNSKKEEYLTDCCLVRNFESPIINYDYASKQCLELNLYGARLAIAVLAAIDSADESIPSLLSRVITGMKQSKDLLKSVYLVPALKVATKSGKVHILRLLKNEFKHLFLHELDTVCLMATQCGHLHLIEIFFDLPKGDRRSTLITKMACESAQFNQTSMLIYLMRLDKKRALACPKELIIKAFTYNAIEVLDILNQNMPSWVFTQAFGPRMPVYCTVKPRMLDWLYVHHRHVLENCIESIVTKNHSKLISWVAQRFGPKSLIKATLNCDIKNSHISIDIMQLLHPSEHQNTLQKIANALKYKCTDVTAICSHESKFENIQWMCNHGFVPYEGAEDRVYEAGYTCALTTQVGCEIHAFLHKLNVFEGLPDFYADFMALRYDP